VTEPLTRKRALNILKRWKDQAEYTIHILKDHFPHIYNPKLEEWITDGGWTEGFWTGILWWLTVYSKDDKIENWAIHFTRLLVWRNTLSPGCLKTVRYSMISTIWTFPSYLKIPPRKRSRLPVCLTWQRLRLVRSGDIILTRVKSC